MFPLKQQIQQGYKFWQPTFYFTRHKGTDYEANYDTVYLPFSGQVTMFRDFGGGNWLELTRDNGDIIQFAHLSKYLVQPGYYVEGTPVAISGDTGAYTTNPHLHIQVKIHNILVDPEKYIWTDPLPTFNKALRIKLIMNNQPDWKSLTKHAYNIISWFYKYSSYQILPVVDWVYTDFKDYPVKYQPDLLGNQPVKVIDEPWFDSNILPLAKGFDVAVFVMPKKDWTDSVFDNPGLIELGYAYKNPTGPMKVIIALDENDDYAPYYPTIGGFAKYVVHELIHDLYTRCPNDKIVPGGDYTHNHFYGQNGYAMKPEDSFNDLDLSRL